LIAVDKFNPIARVPEVVIGLPLIEIPPEPEAATEVTVPVLLVLLFHKYFYPVVTKDTFVPPDAAVSDFNPVYNLTAPFRYS